MKKTLLFSTAALALLMSACSTTANTAVTESGNTTQSQEQIQEVVDTTPAPVPVEFGKVYFDFDKYNIKPEMQEVIDQGANLLKNQANSVNITVEGNCDEWGTDEYNQALGLKRANAVKQALVTLGIDSQNIAVKSYGETNPVCTDKTPECDAQNRRAEVKIGF